MFRKELTIKNQMLSVWVKGAFFLFGSLCNTCAFIFELKEKRMPSSFIVKWRKSQKKQVMQCNIPEKHK